MGVLVESGMPMALHARGPGRADWYLDHAGSGCRRRARPMMEDDELQYDGLRRACHCPAEGLLLPAS